MVGGEGEPQSCPQVSFGGLSVSRIRYLKELAFQGGEDLGPQALPSVGRHLERRLGVPGARGTCRIMWVFHFYFVRTRPGNP